MMRPDGTDVADRPTSDAIRDALFTSEDRARIREAATDLMLRLTRPPDAIDAATPTITAGRAIDVLVDRFAEVEAALDDTLLDIEVAALAGDRAGILAAVEKGKARALAIMAAEIPADGPTH